MRSIYFTDPNGIALEASWWANDPTGQALIPDAPATVTLIQSQRCGSYSQQECSIRCRRCGSLTSRPAMCTGG
jgi:hypothetical protein